MRRWALIIGASVGGMFLTFLFWQLPIGGGRIEGIETALLIGIGAGIVAYMTTPRSN